MDNSQDPLQTFHTVRGVLSWATPQHVLLTLRTAMQYRRQHMCECEVEPDLPVISAMVYGCRVVEVVEFLRTHSTPEEVCDALAEGRSYMAEQLAIYLGTVAARGQPTEPAQPPLPPGPPPGRARLSPGPGAGRGHLLLQRRPPGARQRRVTPSVPTTAAAVGGPPRLLPGGMPEGRATRCGTTASCGHGPPLFRAPAARWEMEWRRAVAGVCRSPYTDFRVHGKGQGATWTPRAEHRAHRTAQDWSQGRGQRRQRSPSRGATRIGKAAPGGAFGRPTGQQPAGPLAGAPPRGAIVATWHTRAASLSGPPPPSAGDPWGRPEHLAPPAGGEQGQQGETLTQGQMHFEHRLYGAGDPRGDCWSGKMNVRFTRVIAND